MKGDVEEDADDVERPPPWRVDVTNTAEKVEAVGEVVVLKGPGVLEEAGLRGGRPLAELEIRFEVASGVRPRREAVCCVKFPQAACCGRVDLGVEELSEREAIEVEGGRGKVIYARIIGSAQEMIRREESVVEHWDRGLQETEKLHDEIFHFHEIECEELRHRRVFLNSTRTIWL